MSQSATPLFVDTSALYAHFVANTPRHDRARAVFDGVRDGDLAFRPLYTSGYVLGELATLLVRRGRHEIAVDALNLVRSSPSVSVLHPGTETFGATCTAFERYDDQEISFVDHLTGVLARERNVDHIFAFDDDFRTLGFRLVPAGVDL
jgi:predicted nucleic acid-binding protein